MLQIFHNIFGITTVLSSRFSYQCKAVWWWRKSQETKASTFLKKTFSIFCFKMAELLLTTNQKLMAFLFWIAEGWLQKITFFFLWLYFLHAAPQREHSWNKKLLLTLLTSWFCSLTFIWLSIYASFSSVHLYFVLTSDSNQKQTHFNNLIIDLTTANKFGLGFEKQVALRPTGYDHDNGYRILQKHYCS